MFKYSVSDLRVFTFRIDNDVNGNPRYYLPEYLLPGMPDNVRLELGLVKYRGKKFGPGYVLSAYGMDKCLQRIIDRINEEGLA